MLAELQQRIADGETPLSLISEIEKAVVARRGEHGQHAAWGLLCEEAGLLSLAFTEFQLALRDDRHDEVAALRLAVHYRERGDFDRAVKLLEALLARDAARADCIRMHTLFAGQEGVYARQWAKPGGKSSTAAGDICWRKKTVWKSWFGAKTNDGETHSLSLREWAGVRARGVAKPDYSSTRSRLRKKSGRPWPAQNARL